MLPPGPQLILGFTLAAVVALSAWRLGALDRSGALGAFLIGGAVFGFGGPVWGAVLVAFFLSSSALSYFRSDRKADITDSGSPSATPKLESNAGQWRPRSRARCRCRNCHTRESLVSYPDPGLFWRAQRRRR